MAKLVLKKTSKIPRSLFTNNFLNHWLEEFAETERVTADAWQGDFATFAKILESGFESDEGLDRSAKLLLKLFSLSHKTHQTDKWLDLIPLISKKVDTDRLNLELRIRLLNRLGQTCRLHKRTDEALAFHQQALTLCQNQASPNSFCWADCYLHLAEFFSETHQSAKALEYNSALMELPNFSDLPISFQATARNSAGLVHQALGHTREAIKHFQMATKIWESEGDDIEQVRTLLNIGFSRLKLDELEEAQEIFEKALSLADPYPYKKIIVLNNLGILKFNAGDAQKAIIHWEAGIHAGAHLVEQPHGIGEILHNLGFVNRELEHYSLAVSFFDRAILTWRQLNATFELAKSLGGKAQAFLEWGKFQEAIDVYDRAIGMLGDVAADNWLLVELQTERGIAQQKLI